MSGVIASLPQVIGRPMCWVPCDPTFGPNFGLFRRDRLAPIASSWLPLGAGFGAAAGHLCNQVIGHPRPAPGADRDTDRAALVLVEERQTAVEIDVPFLDPAHPLFLLGDRVRRAGIRTNPAIGAEVVGAKYVRFARFEGQIGQHQAEAEIRSELAVDHRAVPAQLTQARRDGRRDHDHLPGHWTASRLRVPALFVHPAGQRPNNLAGLVGRPLLGQGPFAKQRLDAPFDELVTVGPVNATVVAAEPTTHINGEVFFYADAMTRSMRKAIDETNRRRQLQLDYNEKNNIVPRSIVKTLDEVRLSTSVADVRRVDGADVILESDVPTVSLARQLEQEMLIEAKALNYEKAASLRDRLDEVLIQLAVKEESRESRRRS